MLADCGGPAPEVECSCCTSCCSDGQTSCPISSIQLCENHAQDLERHRELEEEVQCDCSDDYWSVLCNYVNCPTCNEDGTICGTTSFGYKFDPEDPESRIWTSSFEYHTGRPKATISWENNVIDDRCKVSVDGQECEFCGIRVCTDGYSGFIIECQNVLIADDGPLHYNSCDPQTGGVLDVFEWVDSASFMECPFRTRESSRSIHQVN